MSDTSSKMDASELDERPATPFAGIAPDLLKGGKYSDLIIACENQKFPVHKNIVCPQSEVIAAPFDTSGAFKESIENTFVISDFDPKTVWRMLEYMYYGSYSVEETDAAEAPTTAATTSDQDAIAKSVSSKTVERAMCHLHVCNIALCYVVEGLANLAKLRVREMLDSDIPNETFLTIMNQSVPEALKLDFECILAEACVPRLEWLLNHGHHGIPNLSHFSFELMKRMKATREASIKTQLKIKRQLELCEKNLKDADMVIFCSTCDSILRISPISGIKVSRDRPFEDSRGLPCKSCRRYQHFEIKIAFS